MSHRAEALASRILSQIGQSVLLLWTMNFTRKRPRDGPPQHPPPKRHDHKPEEKRDAPQTKAAPSAPPKTTTPQPPTATVEKKPPPPAPPKSSLAEAEQQRFDVTSPKLVADVPSILALLESVRETSTMMLDKTLSTEGSTPEAKEEIKDLGRTGLVALAQLRSLHRQVHTEVDLRRQQSSSYQDTEFLSTMQVLQSTKYELDAFKSLVDAQPSIDNVPGLVSEQDYKKEAKGHNGPNASDSEHDKMLKRLKFEEDRRKAMRVKLKEIPAKQHSLKLGLQNETRDLDTMKREIREIGRQVSKLQHSLKLEPITLQQTDPRANSLSQPLYNLYVQFTSWISVFGSDQIEVSVSGVVESTTQADRQPKQQKGRRGDKNASSAPSGDGKLSSEQCRQVHPLSIMLQITVPSSANNAAQRKVSFIFEYLTNLNIVIVTPLNNEDPRILVNLFPNDNGESSPNPANILQIAPGAEWMPRRARAYKWAQSLCGLHFHSEPTDMFAPSGVSADTHINQASSLTDTIELLKKRVKSHFDFNGITSALNSGNIESQQVIRPNAPETGTMRRWAILSPNDARKTLRDMENYYETHRMTPTGEVIIDANKIYFNALFGTKASQTLQVCVGLSPEYPTIAPTFIIKSSDSSLVPSEIQLINEALLALQPVPTVPDSPETLINYTLLWLRGCSSIIDDMQKHGSDSQFSKLNTRYRVETW